MIRLPGFRTTLGIAACGVYFWRIQDPKGSYSAFFDATDWLTTTASSLFVADSAVTGFLRNVINLVLLDQVEGFLIGMVFVTLLAAILWPIKAGSKLAARGVKKAFKRKPQPFIYPATAPDEAPPLLLTDIISPQPTESSLPGSSAQT